MKAKFCIIQFFNIPSTAQVLVQFSIWFSSCIENKLAKWESSAPILPRLHQQQASNCHLIMDRFSRFCLVGAYFLCPFSPNFYELTVKFSNFLEKQAESGKKKRWSGQDVCLFWQWHVWRWRWLNNLFFCFIGYYIIYHTFIYLYLYYFMLSIYYYNNFLTSVFHFTFQC